MKIELEGVQQTLLMPLWGRAKMSREKNTFFFDSKAIELVQNLEFDFSKIDSTIPVEGNISTVVRARTIDDKIKEFLRIHPKGTIVNLGAGLETTYFRIKSNSLTWYDIDLPEVINLKRKLIPETNNFFYISESIFDFNWIKRINHSISDGLLFISVGVLEYFSKEVVLKFLSDLANLFPGGEMVFNTSTNNRLASYFTKRTMKKMNIEANPAICGNNYIKNISKANSRIEIVDRFKLFSKIDQKSYFDKTTMQKLRYYEIFSPSYIVQIKFL